MKSKTVFRKHRGLAFNLVVLMVAGISCLCSSNPVFCIVPRSGTPSAIMGLKGLQIHLRPFEVIKRHYPVEYAAGKQLLWSNNSKPAPLFVQLMMAMRSRLRSKGAFYFIPASAVIAFQYPIKWPQPFPLVGAVYSGVGHAGPNGLKFQAPNKVSLISAKGSLSWQYIRIPHSRVKEPTMILTMVGFLNRLSRRGVSGLELAVVKTKCVFHRGIWSIALISASSLGERK